MPGSWHSRGAFDLQGHMLISAATPEERMFNDHPKPTALGEKSGGPTAGTPEIRTLENPRSYSSPESGAVAPTKGEQRRDDDDHDDDARTLQHTLPSLPHTPLVTPYSPLAIQDNALQHA